MKLLANIDGASRGNPGPGAAAAVLRNPEGSKVRECGLYLGECTNNFAEYSALALALQLAHASGAQELDICSDSELLVKQFSGEYKIKNAELAGLMSG
ncbi:MAG TPA: reverse transcriptase-like protein, partial [Elusimicrobiales bacterium]|nr:reverse transcriptase-like protein [Elusimicrobiales bacterium]